MLRSAGQERSDVLVNNAGLYSGRYRKTVDNIELTFAVNHLAPFLLTHELMPLLRAAPSARVITVSSFSHYRTFLELQRLEAPRPYLGIWAYKVSKLANVLFSAELNRRIAGSPICAFAVDPGLVNTEIALKEEAGWIAERQRRQAECARKCRRTILHLAWRTRSGRGGVLVRMPAEAQPAGPARIPHAVELSAACAAFWIKPGEVDGR
jgi:NAD(P)-dependent dehydrogenase (short-subunit alcohol dehydrogenase family)